MTILVNIAHLNGLRAIFYLQNFTMVN